jgi:uncharacterized phage-associated protein
MDEVRTRLEVVDFDVKSKMADVADWFLLKGHMSNKKIQKLCYYAQAWSLALLDKDIAIDAEFEAWVHGPVNRSLYRKFKEYGWKELKIDDEDVETTKEALQVIFNDSQINVLEAVWEAYGQFSADQLETLTHQESPWLEKREGYGKFESCVEKLSTNTMREYYSSKIEN